MSIVSLAILKSYFETGDFPTQQEFIDLIDTLGLQNNLRTVEYTIGVPGVTGVDYNFTSVANTTEQSIQLGGTAILPANSPTISIVVKCTDGLNGGITVSTDVGSTAGGLDRYYNGVAGLGTLDAISAGNAFAAAVMSSSASSVYLSFTPSANWNTMTTGKWKVWVAYLDNSLL